MSGAPGGVTDWEARYRAGTTAWERGAPHPAFLAWRAAGALAPCRILLPGAGRSPEPAALARDGFDVTVVDLAPSAVAAQRAALAGLSGRVEQADLLAWTPERPFDAAYDQTFLCALPPVALPAYAAWLARWIRPGGALFALLMQTGRPGGPPFACPPAAMHELLPDALWRWPDTLPDAIPHPSGGREIPVMLRRTGTIA